jgi:hypothetical protein
MGIRRLTAPLFATLATVALGSVLAITVPSAFASVPAVIPSAVVAGASGTHNLPAGLAEKDTFSIKSTWTNIAGVTCRSGIGAATLYFKNTNIVVADVAQSVSWCYNGLTVLSAGLGTHGYVRGRGWGVNSAQPPVSKNCYVAKGSTRGCSGNHMAVSYLFCYSTPQINCIAAWTPHIQEWVNYHGQAFTAGLGSYHTPFL